MQPETEHLSQLKVVPLMPVEKSLLLRMLCEMVSETARPKNNVGLSLT